MPRGEINDCNDNRQSILHKEIHMKKFIVAALILVGLGTVVTYVARNLDN